MEKIYLSLETERRRLNIVFQSDILSPKVWRQWTKGELDLLEFVC